MKLDGKSKNVTVTGVGRIMWRKDYYPRIAKIIFKQYVQKSESQLGGSLIDSSQCDILTAEKVEENPLAEKVEENLTVCKYRPSRFLEYAFNLKKN